MVSHKVASSAYMLTLELGIASGRSLIYKEKSTGLKIEPCVTSQVSVSASDSEPLIWQRCVRYSRYDLNHC